MCLAIIKQLLDEFEHDIMNYQNRGLCYLPQPSASALMSRNARDDKNGRFGERAAQLTMLAKLAILAIFCQFRQIS